MHIECHIKQDFSYINWFSSSVESTFCCSNTFIVLGSTGCGPTRSSFYLRTKLFWWELESGYNLLGKLLGFGETVWEQTDFCNEGVVGHHHSDRTEQCLKGNGNNYLKDLLQNTKVILTMISVYLYWFFISSFSICICWKFLAALFIIYIPIPDRNKTYANIKYWNHVIIVFLYEII